jgi:hypothetical protein
MSLNDEYFNVNDTLKIKKEWQDFKELCAQFEVELTEFLSHKKNKSAGIRARKKLVKMRNLGQKIGQNIMTKKNEYDSDYS